MRIIVLVCFITLNVLFLHRFEYDDPQFQCNINEIDSIFKNLSLFSPENFFPFLAYPPGSKVIKYRQIFSERVANQVNKRVHMHEFVFKICESRGKYFLSF